MMRAACFMAVLLAFPAAADTAQDFADDASGVWQNAEQAQDEGYDFVQSEMTQVMFGRADGVWLFQQNWILAPSPADVPASSVRQSQPPYFQVVIHVRDIGDGALHTTTYRLSGETARDEARYISPENSDFVFSPNWIGEVACMGRMQQFADGYWEGGATCPNGYKGGVKVESRSVRSPGQYVNWDRGFNAAGEHIWGPAKGGYIFKRLEEAQ